MAKPHRVTNKKVIEALEACGGLVAHAAKKLGYSRTYLHTRISKSPELSKALEQVRETNLDLAESKLLKAVNSGELPAIFFYLKCQGKKRGYVERYDIQDAEEMPTKVEVEIKDCRRREDGE